MLPAAEAAPTEEMTLLNLKDHLFLPWFLHGFKLAMYAALTPRRCVLLEYAFHLQHLSRKAWKNNEHNEMAFVFI